MSLQSEQRGRLSPRSVDSRFADTSLSRPRLSLDAKASTPVRASSSPHLGTDEMKKEDVVLEELLDSATIQSADRVQVPRSPRSGHLRNRTFTITGSPEFDFGSFSSSSNTPSSSGSYSRFGSLSEVVSPIFTSRSESPPSSASSPTEKSFFYHSDSSQAGDASLPASRNGSIEHVTPVRGLFEKPLKARFLRSNSSSSPSEAPQPSHTPSRSRSPDRRPSTQRDAPRPNGQVKRKPVPTFDPSALSQTLSKVESSRVERLAGEASTTKPHLRRFSSDDALPGGKASNDLGFTHAKFSWEGSSPEAEAPGPGRTIRSSSCAPPRSRSRPPSPPPKPRASSNVNQRNASVPNLNFKPSFLAPSSSSTISTTSISPPFRLRTGSIFADKGGNKLRGADEEQDVHPLSPRTPPTPGTPAASSTPTRFKSAPYSYKISSALAEASTDSAATPGAKATLVSDVVTFTLPSGYRPEDVNLEWSPKQGFDGSGKPCQQWELKLKPRFTRASHSRTPKGSSDLASTFTPPPTPFHFVRPELRLPAEDGSTPIVSPGAGRRNIASSIPPRPKSSRSLAGQQDYFTRKASAPALSMDPQESTSRLSPRPAAIKSIASPVLSTSLSDSNEPESLPFPTTRRRSSVRPPYRPTKSERDLSLLMMELWGEAEGDEEKVAKQLQLPSSWSDTSADEADNEADRGVHV
ncbi:hypothetical protein MNV49_007797 [Pseudohyphozyma bogoriensis]|nr:hypothetical protein MNV49_007797 [Pseudohyphozyma bogoriensis]